jgi:hypothetical protein
VNRYRKKRKCQSPDFDLLSRFLLEIGDHLGPVAIHFNECGYDKNEREQEYRGDSNRDQAGFSADGHSDLQSKDVLGATRNAAGT